MICPQCGTENRPGARFCAQCGAPLTAETVAWSPSPAEPAFSVPPPPPPPSPVIRAPGPAAVEKRYPILRVLSVIYKVLGGIVAAFTILGVIGSCIVGIAGGTALGELERELGTPLPGIGGMLGGIIAGLIILLYGGFAALFLYAFGELISLFISMEENIRSLAQR